MVSSNPITSPPPITSAPCSSDDQGPDILDIISAMEQSDLENSSLPQSMTETELFAAFRSLEVSQWLTWRAYVTTIKARWS
ncbi:hypothetical protein DFH29DRAFT_1010426 [Suillus ampliporus]|nr:hypothetical protein DFH29DRAFT_1010426 [Suillus ampliporus]